MQNIEITNLLRRACQYIEGKEDVRMMSAMTDGKRLYCDVLEGICKIQEAAPSAPKTELREPGALEARIKTLELACEAAKGAIQANLEYATRKDEAALLGAYHVLETALEAEPLSEAPNPPGEGPNPVTSKIPQGERAPARDGGDRG